VKERVTVTIERSLLKTIDASVDGMQVKNRSHAVELLIERALKQVMPSQAVILAGGDSKKLLKPVNNKPVILHNIELLSRHGVSDIVLIITKQDTKVKEYLGDGNAHDVQLTYVEEKEKLGTAGALNMLREQLNAPFILMNGDELKNVDIKDMYNFHKQNHGLCTIALTSVQDPAQYGVALLNGNQIVTFIEKPPKNAPSNLISAGLYIMEPDVLRYIPKGFARIETDVFPKLAKDNSLIGYPFSGQYIDVQQQGVTERLTNIWKGFSG
jgi:NDP-sugar pyrophosphorylase family protein